LQIIRTRIKVGPHYPKGEHSTRTEDVPDTWIEAHPVAGLDYDNRPHYDNLPEPGMKRQMNISLKPPIRAAFNLDRTVC
jgi:hypothetical protein